MKGFTQQDHLSDFLCCNCSNAKDFINMGCDILGGDPTVDRESMVLNISFNPNAFMFSSMKHSSHLGIIAYFYSFVLDGNKLSFQK